MNKEQELQKLISELDVFKQKLSRIDYIHNKYDFLEIMRELRKFLSSIIDDEIVELFLHSRFFIENHEFFVWLNQYFIRAIEADESLWIMSKNNNENSIVKVMDVDYIIEDYQRKWNDIKDLNIKEGQTLTMVWCWPMPETILYFYENTPIKKIIWVDYNYEAIYIAWEIIRMLWYTDILLKYADWTTFDYSESDIIYIPSFVDKKREVLNQIVKTWKKDVQILVRDVEWMTKLVYNALSPDINPELKITSKSQSEWIYHRTKMVKFEKYNI